MGQTNQIHNSSLPDMATMPLTKEHYKVLVAGSMEQVIGAALSTVVGVMIPMIQLSSASGLSSFMQGIMGAIALIGIAVGSTLIGYLADREGYLWWFRACPLIIVAGSLMVIMFPTQPWILLGLFLAGFGVGGGYSLDSSYISEIMPDRWKIFMVGVAKGTCAVGFILAAVICWAVLKGYPHAGIWNRMMWIVTAMGGITFLLRLNFTQSPEWLMEKGRPKEAAAAARKLLGEAVTVPVPPAPKTDVAKVSYFDMFKGANLRRVILTGIPWACEGLGVYGFGVFLPVLVMALGIERGNETGIAQVMNSVEMTAIINFFILPGFAVGLLLLRKLNHIGMLAGGFIICTCGLGMLLVAYCLHLPVWVSVVGFIIFEVFLNAGPHLITFILPSQVFPVEVRSTGAGIAAMLGKIGAVLGVFFMPMLLKWGGIVVLLWVSIAVQIVGALVAILFRPKNQQRPSDV